MVKQPQYSNLLDTNSTNFDGVGIIHNRTYIPIENPKSKAPLLAIGIKPNSPTLFFDVDIIGFPENDIIINEVNEYKNTFIPQIIFNDDAVKEIRESNSIYERIYAFVQYKERVNFFSNLSHYHWAIYRTKHGYHIVIQMATWDRVQFSLYELKVIFPKSFYTIDHKYQRLRISPKWDYKTGEIVSDAPELYESCSCYKESRIGTKESYLTYD